jgi:hypothetical protein
MIIVPTVEGLRKSTRSKAGRALVVEPATKRAPPIQVQTDDGTEWRRFYCFDLAAAPDQAVEVEWEDSHESALESFLLPDLRAAGVYPPRAQWVPPKHWELIDPASNVPPLALAITAKGDKPTGRFIIGVADWPEGEERTSGHLWAEYGPEERKAFMDIWADLERN